MITSTDRPVGLHPMAPWTDITFAGVYHNDAERVGRLLDAVRPWFVNIAVAVQCDDPDDETLRVCEEKSDRLVIDPVYGHAEPSIGKLLGVVRTPWTFLISADEMPSPDLLYNFQDAIQIAEHGDDYSTIDGFWIRFVSSIEGIDYPSEQDNHLRLFQTRLGWPTTMHSRPAARNAVFWPESKGHVRHDRSLDEMMIDYLRYFQLGSANDSWKAHNRLMMHDACVATAEHYGWDYVKAFPWWPQVEAIAFS